MSVQVRLPPGCEGVNSPGGYRSPDTRAGGTVTVPDSVAAAIERTYGGDAGLVQAKNRVFLGTKNGRWCKNCQPARCWNAWNAFCPRCNAPTEPEDG